MSSSTSGIPGEHPEERRRERAVIRSGALTLFQRQAFTPILDVIRSELRIAAAGITIIHEDSAFVIAASGIPVGVYDRSVSFCAHAILETEDLMVVPDTREDDRFRDNAAVDDQSGVRFFAAFQLLDDDKMPLGAIWVFDTEPRHGLTNSESASLRRISHAVIAKMRRHAVVTSD